ncbi:LPXTG cell wall anchor domain-containing protein [Staphylococcus epidermidis]|jgi:LPXTG-motif cell wall-anchored protein|uniref:LPXTG cell wall anchor domain-containing protein n=1 Tax=Staphylococcus epidermidis TaxID=1282 RepID=UPI002DBE6286|nr:LPXTG cell wall anchor domain-containing protein [Staphylococcus epidermidis]MEB5645482.1 LPXTG cell wall anchor domain-containing protein [Staphylococcus epidermidis]MEB6729641.1 LPXTG cell wall anchor domain-containing protein [Staphylococcus epidermidis]
MKSLKILGATTVTGALLFTGIGTGYLHQAHAADNYTSVNGNNAVDIAKSVQSQNGFDTNSLEYSDAKNKGDHYEIHAHNKSHVGGSIITVYKDGTVKSSAGLANPESTKVGQYDLNQNNKYQEQANNNNTTTQNNDQQQTSQSTNNPKFENNTQSQNQTQTLPETGEKQQTSGLTTMIAAVLLAIGSLFTLRRTSKN